MVSFALPSLMILIAGVSIILLSELRNSEAGHQSDHLIHYTEKLDNGSVIYHNFVNRSIVNGIPMEVCGPANLETAANEAIKRWEDALGIDLFSWKSYDASGCLKAHKFRHLGVASVTIYINSDLAYKECGKYYDPHMCVYWGNDASGHRGYHTIFGQPDIVVNDVEAEYATLTSARVKRDLTHEFGHIIGLEDYYCTTAYGRPQDQLSGVRTLMNSTTELKRCNSPNHRPTQMELDDYCAAYLPEAPGLLGPSGSESGVPGDTDGKVTIKWNPEHVHVEMGFEVLRWDGTAWVGQTTVGFDEESVELENQPGGQQYYAVASITKAFPHDGKDHFRGPSSAKISVVVPGEASSTPSMPSSPPTTEGCNSLPSLLTHTLNASAAAGGSVTCTVFGGLADCVGEVAEGTNIAVSALAADGYAFERWEGPGVSSDDTPHVRTVRMDTNRTVVAHFGHRMAVELWKTPHGQIPVECRSWECGSVKIRVDNTMVDGSQVVVPPNASVSFTAAMKPRWAFTGWSSISEPASIDNPYRITATRNFTVIANFTLKPAGPTGLRAGGATAASPSTGPTRPIRASPPTSTA